MAGCGEPAAPPARVAAPSARAAPAPSAARPTTLREAGLDPDALDRSADPCQDFYQFACGGWLQRAEIPADESRVYRVSSIIKRRTNDELRRIVEGAARDPGGDPAKRALGAFYAACLDEGAVEAAGLQPLAPLFDEARKVRDAASLWAALGRLHRSAVGAVFRITDDQWQRDPVQVVATLDQPRLGLPSRDDYLDPGPRARQRRDAYVAHVERMLRLLGDDAKAARRGAADALAIEIELARASKSSVERRDMEGMFNRVDRKGLEALAPGLDWGRYFAALGFPGMEAVSVTSKPYFASLAGAAARFKPAAWQSYLRFCVVRARAETLPKAFVDEDFALTRALSGQAEPEPRWRRCLDATGWALRDHLGRAFVERRFPPEARAAAVAMTREVGEAFAERLAAVDWMDPETRRRALEKRAKMGFLIGHPERWRDYDFAIDPKSHAANALAADEADVRRRLSTVGRPLDVKDWDRGAWARTAYHDYGTNHVALPAGFLQAPRLDPAAADAVNFGVLGAYVGHEITHGFDEIGSHRGPEGLNEEWWRPEARARFEAKSRCVVEQYSAYEALPGVKVDGRLVLSESIADNGGLRAAFRAYQKRLSASPGRSSADGFGDEQQFFLAFGQSLCAKFRDEDAREYARSDPHPPPKFAVNGSVANAPEFARAFSCPAGAPMSPRRRCEIW
ncbi:MAG TPA: M13 family metallopeptidase [Polyangiaceae bacterium]|nr:M13 family metallopeptidase [Polyangiaceae bacterium]